MFPTSSERPAVSSHAPVGSRVFAFGAADACAAPGAEAQRMKATQKMKAAHPRIF
jgi:hypothetical protein